MVVENPYGLQGQPQVADPALVGAIAVASGEEVAVAAAALPAVGGEEVVEEEKLGRGLDLPAWAGFRWDLGQPGRSGGPRVGRASAAAFRPPPPHRSGAGALGLARCPPALTPPPQRGPRPVTP